MSFFSRKVGRKIILLVADTHGGHKLGLMNPEVTLIDEDECGNPVEYHPALTATQEFLWQCFEADLGEAGRIAGGAPITILHNGDLGHGDKYPEQLVSVRKADQIAIGTANLEPMLALPNVVKLRLIAGTQAHSFGEGTIEILVTYQLQAEYPRVDVGCIQHGLFDVDGLALDCAHHGPSPGIRDWTSGNQLRYYTHSVMDQALADGEDAPDVLVRAHYHTYRRETVRKVTKRGEFATEAILLPSYSGLSGHGRQATRSKHRIDIGMVLLDVRDGALADVHALHRLIDLRTREKI